MASLLDSLKNADSGMGRDPQFPHAPADWTRASADAYAQSDRLAPSDMHWDVVRALQEYFFRHGEREINLRELHDALDEKFHAQGGIKHLYKIFPGGPVAQCCRLAGLKPPAGVADKSFGSVA